MYCRRYLEVQQETRSSIIKIISETTNAIPIMTNVRTTFCMAIGLVSVGLHSLPGSTIHLFDIRVICPLSINFPILVKRIENSLKWCYYKSPGIIVIKILLHIYDLLTCNWRADCTEILFSLQMQQYLLKPLHLK